MYIRAITKGKEIVAKRIRKGIKRIEILQNKNSSIFFMSHQLLSKETIMEKIIYTVNAVSYTHLDVYKRQVQYAPVASMIYSAPHALHRILLASASEYTGISLPLIRRP